MLGCWFFWWYLWWSLVRNNISVEWHWAAIFPLQANFLVSSQSWDCAVAMRSWNLTKAWGVMKSCWCEQGRCELIEQRTEGCTLHTGILFTRCWLRLCVKDKNNLTEVFSCRNSAEVQLRPSSGQRFRWPPRQNSCSSQVQQSGSSPKGLESCLIHLALVGRVDWC